jgi:hypothetical protein
LLLHWRTGGIARWREPNRWNPYGIEKQSIDFKNKEWKLRFL